MTFLRKLWHLGLSFHGLSKWEKDRLAAVLSGGIVGLVGEMWIGLYPCSGFT